MRVPLPAAITRRRPPLRVSPVCAWFMLLLLLAFGGAGLSPAYSPISSQFGVHKLQQLRGAPQNNQKTKALNIADAAGPAMAFSPARLFEGNYHFGVAALSSSLVTETSACVGRLPGRPAGMAHESPAYDAATATYQVSWFFQLRMVLLDTPMHFTLLQADLPARDFREARARHRSGRLHRSRHRGEGDRPSFCGWFTERRVSLVEDVNWPSRRAIRSACLRTPSSPSTASRRSGRASATTTPASSACHGNTWTSSCSGTAVPPRARLQPGCQAPEGGRLGDALPFDRSGRTELRAHAREATLNTAGPDAKDFIAGGYYLLARDRLAQALEHAACPQGARRPVTVGGDRGVRFEHVEGRSGIFSNAELKRHRLALRVASATGRVYQRR